VTDASDTNRDAPNDVLAARIAIALYAGGLVREKHKESVQSKLGNGKARESDWRLWAEDVVLAKERADGDESED
jgi:hypothetical protein